jgi:hypothetical protein
VSYPREDQQRAKHTPGPSEGPEGAVPLQTFVGIEAKLSVKMPWINTTVPPRHSVTKWI